MCCFVSKLRALFENVVAVLEPGGMPPSTGVKLMCDDFSIESTSFTFVGEHDMDLFAHPAMTTIQP